MKHLNFPIYSMLLGLLIGIVSNYYLNFTSTTIYFSIIICGLIGLLCWLFYQKIKNYLVLINVLIFISIGQFLQHHYYQSTQNNFLNQSIGKSHKIVGFVSDKLKDNPYNHQYFFTVTNIDGQPTNVRVLLQISKKNLTIEAPKINEKLAIVSSFDKIPFKGNLYGFDFREYLNKKGFQHQINLYQPNFKVIGLHKNLFYHTNNIRWFLENKINNFQLYPQSKAILKALVLGQKDAIDHSTYSDFSKSGAVHLLAISGLHVGIILIFLNFLLKPIIYFQKVKLLKPIVMIVFLWFFAFLTGLSPSVSRAVTMFSFLIIGYYYQNQVSIYHHLANSMVVLIIFKPAIIFEVGFQLSYAAVFSIVSLNKFFSQWQPKNAILGYIYQIMAVSTAAQIGVLPITLYYFHQFPGMFLLSNLVAIPLITILLFLSFIIIFLSLIISCPKILFTIYDTLITWMLKFINAMSNLDNLYISQISFDFNLLIYSYIIVLFFIWMVYRVSFRSLFVFCCLIAGFLFLNYMIMLSHQKESVFIVFNKKNENLYIKRVLQKSVIYTNIPNADNNRTIQNYLRGSFCKAYTIKSINNFYQINNTKILLIYNTYSKIDIHPDVIILSNNPKINFHQLLLDYKPKKVIADGTNPNIIIKKWQKTCEQNNIAFASTYDSGYEIIK